MSGVKSQQAQLDVIGNNIANVNTTGYKASRMTFADALSETISGAKGQAGNFTGANPIQIGRGVMISSIDTNFKQGSLDASGIISDVAINGKGFFVVTDGTQKFYTRAGGFQILDDGSIMAQGGNYFVMGRLADDRGRLQSTTAMEKLTLPFGRKEPAKATSNVDVYCNLDKNASKVEEWLGKDQILSNGKPIKGSTDLALIDGNKIMLGDQIEITGTDRDGKKILDPDNKIYTFTYGVDGLTMQDLLERINYVFNSTNPVTGATVTLDQAGRMRFEANTAGETEFSISLSAKSGNHATTTEIRHSERMLIAGEHTALHQLTNHTNMGYATGDYLTMEYAGQTRIFSFHSADISLQDIVNWMNDSFGEFGADFILHQIPGSDKDVTIKDTKGGNFTIAGTTTFASATGLNVSTPSNTTNIFTLNLNHAPATTASDLRHILDTSININRSINITGTNPDGTFVSGTFTYGPLNDGTTVQDLLNTINKIFYGVTATLSPDGKIVLTDNAPGESLSTINITNGTTSGFNIAFETEKFTSSMPLYIPDAIPNFHVVAPITTDLNSLKRTINTPYQEGDIITIAASQMNGKTYSVDFIYGPHISQRHSGTTIEDLINFINNSNQFPGLTASYDTISGEIKFTDNSLNDMFNYTSIQIFNSKETLGRGLENTFTTNAGTNNSTVLVPSFSPVTEGVTGKHHSAITVYDSSGQAHRIDIRYTQDLVPGSNKWYWEIMIDEGKIAPTTGGSGSVTFNDNGSLKTFAYDNGTQLRFNVLGGEEVKIKLNAGTSGAFDGMTSLDSASTNILIEQDGYPMGTLNSININDQGIISGIYSNGVSKALAQIALANFTNEAGLQKEGNNLYASNGSSGVPIISWAGTNNSTVLKSGYLEASNVDLTEEFSKMIISQRALEANAKVISTADMVLSTIIDRMKRT